MRTYRTTFRASLSALSGWLFLTLFSFAGLTHAADSLTREPLRMYVGEVRVLEFAPIERVAIGNPKVASNSILPDGQLVLLADAAGVTTLHIWLKDGGEKELDVTVSEKQVLDQFRELTTLLAGIPGVSPSQVGETVVVKGTVSKKDKPQYDRILSRYQDILDLVVLSDATSEITRLLEGIPGIAIKEVGGYTVITGEINTEYEPLIKIVEQKYPNILNMTRTREAVAGKMINMKVRIMEMNKTFTEKLGINWKTTDILGPTFVFGVESTRNGATLLTDDTANVPQALKKSGNTDLSSASGYFGIATGINSFLDLSESTGDAVSLAEPSLSTRSGGKAEFLAGGEFPVPVTTSLGSTDVEFKKYGISLNIEPVVDDRGNILAHVETEISTIDKGNAVNLIPGVKSRRTSTDVSLRAEETLVIAGLVQDLAGKDYNNVKWLSDLPVLGPLFQSKDFQNQKTELVIFITPTIYDTDSPHNTGAMETGEKINRKLAEMVKGNELLE
ncbi:MAG: type II and III secretion system protein family protein [Desulfobulbaceae bacterium]